MFTKVLLPVDPDERVTWERALPAAVKIAQTHGAKLMLMTVVPSFGSNLVASFFPKDFEQDALNQAEKELADLAKAEVPDGLADELIVAHGRIWQEICRVAEEQSADLIVMASHKPDFHDVLLAPNADQVLHHAPISVMVVR